MIFLGILVSVVMFSIIVIIHEYGHYKTARFFGIHVAEFGLGIPPRAKKLWKNKDGTLFSLNWIPLGGFVKITGEQEPYFNYYSKKGKKLTQEKLLKKLNKDIDIFDKKKNVISKIERQYLLAKITSHRPGENFYEKNIFIKSSVLLAGVVMNFLLAAFIFSILFIIGVKPVGINTFIDTSLPSKLIPTIEQSLSEGLIIQEDGIALQAIKDSIAEKSGILKGDILLKIGMENISTIEQAQKIISQNADQDIILTILRDSKIEIINIRPNNDGKIGSYLAPNYVLQDDFFYKYGIIEGMKYGFLETYYQSRLTLDGLGFLLKNIISPESPNDRKQAIDQLAGPIGIVGVISNAMSGGIVLLIILGAIISINLGVFNLLPIPALDGGRLVLLWIRSGIEFIFGKSEKTKKIENNIHILFFILLIALSLLIAYNDINKLI